MKKLSFQEFLFFAVESAKSIAKGYNFAYKVDIKTFAKKGAKSISTRNLEDLLNPSAGSLKDQEIIKKQRLEKQESIDSLALCVSWVTGGWSNGNSTDQEAEPFTSVIADGDLTFALFSFLGLLELDDMSLADYVFKLKDLETQGNFSTEYDYYGNYDEVSYKAVNLKALYKALGFE